MPRDETLSDDLNDILLWGSAIEDLMIHPAWKEYGRFEDFQSDSFLKALLSVLPGSANFGERIAYAKGFVDGLLKVQYNRLQYIEKAREIRERRSSSPRMA